MDIIDFALKMENDGENYYRKLAKEASNEGLTHIFSHLADEELNHYNSLVKMKRGAARAPLKSESLNRVKNIFQQLKAEHSRVDPTDDQLEAYKKARDIETQSIKFYSEKAKNSTDDLVGKLFEQIAAEEEQHLQILNTMVDYIEKPDTWVEDAEFNPREAY